MNAAGKQNMHPRLTGYKKPADAVNTTAPAGSYLLFDLICRTAVYSLTALAVSFSALRASLLSMISFIICLWPSPVML